jgi:hypothetical protein
MEEQKIRPSEDVIDLLNRNLADTDLLNELNP